MSRSIVDAWARHQAKPSAWLRQLFARTARHAAHSRTGASARARACSYLRSFAGAGNERALRCTSVIISPLDERSLIVCILGPELNFNEDLCCAPLPQSKRHSRPGGFALAPRSVIPQARLETLRLSAHFRERSQSGTCRRRHGPAAFCSVGRTLEAGQASWVVKKALA